MNSLSIKLSYLFRSWSHLFVALIGVVTFLVSFYVRLSYIPLHYWKNRDDGVITLSSAKHFVEFGFVGVSPSGEMVEAFSAPLQAFIFGLSYWITSISYDSYIMYQGFLSTALLGGIVGVFFSILFSSRRVAAAATIFAALLMLYSGNFIVWHFSGMENCLTHAAVTLALTYGWLIATNTKPLNKYGACFLAVISFSRIDLVIEVGGILLFACILRCRITSWQESISFYLKFVLSWFVLLGLKWLCFGSLIPHTATAQLIEPTKNFVRLTTVEGRAEVLSLLSLIRERQMLDLGIALTPLALLCVPLLRVRSAVILLFGAIGCALFRGYLFGGARLDPVRTVSYLSVVQPLLASVILFNLRFPPRFRYLASLVLLLPVVAQGFSNKAPFACCSSEEFERIRCAALKIKEKHSIHRPLLANPDLGAISFHKEFNIYDFGRLANPVLTKLNSDEEIQTHFFLLTAPDIVEITPFWVERNLAVIKSSRFLEQYTKISTVIEECSLSSNYDFYVRNEVALGAATRERYLNDAMARSLDADVIKDELLRCTSSNPADCFYVARVIFRYLPEIRSSHQLQKFEAMLMSSSASDLFKRFVMARIHSSHDSSWSKEYINVLREFHSWKNVHYQPPD
jgi:hypothetical protein